jgi:predicted transcriptional regulator
MPKAPPALSFRVDPALKSALEALAKADRRTLSAYITLVLERHVADQKAPRGTRRT